MSGDAGWLMTQPTHGSSGVSLWVVKKPDIFSSDKNFTLASLENTYSITFLPGYNFSKIFNEEKIFACSHKAALVTASRNYEKNS